LSCCSAAMLPGKDITRLPATPISRRWRLRPVRQKRRSPPRMRWGMS